MIRIRTPWLAIGAGVLALVLFVSGVLAGRAWFSKVIIQPVEQRTREIITKLQPGESFRETIVVPGPIQTVTREIRVTNTRVQFVTTPPQLTLDQLKKVQEEALRRFLIDMRIAANTLIPCTDPKIVEKGIACGHDIDFKVELAEVSPGVILPLTLPGEFAQPKRLTVEVKPDLIGAAPDTMRHWFVYAGGKATLSGKVNAVVGVSYRNRGCLPALINGTYEVRIERTWPDSETSVTAVCGASW